MSEQEEELTTKLVKGVSRHGFRSAAEVALAHYESKHGAPEGKLRVEFYITADNPVRDYIAVLVPPGS
jgi:hypothetical protein